MVSCISRIFLYGGGGGGGGGLQQSAVDILFLADKQTKIMKGGGKSVLLSLQVTGEMGKGT